MLSCPIRDYMGLPGPNCINLQASFRPSPSGRGTDKDWQMKEEHRRFEKEMGRRSSSRGNLKGVQGSRTGKVRDIGIKTHLEKRQSGNLDECVKV